MEKIMYLLTYSQGIEKMPRVMFPFVNSPTTIIYPDDPLKFTNCEIINGDFIIADYSGDLPLDPAPPPAERIVLSINIEYWVNSDIETMVNICDSRGGKTLTEGQQTELLALLDSYGLISTS